MTTSQQSFSLDLAKAITYDQKKRTLGIDINEVTENTFSSYINDNLQLFRDLQQDLQYNSVEEVIIEFLLQGLSDFENESK